MTKSKTFILPFFTSILFLFLLQSTAHAQNDLEYNYLKVNTQSIKREGILRYMTFHDHNSTLAPNAPYHEHYYRDPLTPALETYKLTTLSAQWYLNSRTLAYFYVPYLSNERQVDNSLNDVVKKSGIGDIIIGGKHYLYNSALFRQQSAFKQYLLFGIGIKLPSGSYKDFDDQTSEIEPLFQPGSGTMDFLLTGDYQLQYNHFILQTNVKYRINRENEYTYRFGNQINLGVEALYEWALNPQIGIVPNVALQYADSQSNELNGKILNGNPVASRPLGTGEQLLWGSVGMAVKINCTQLQFDYFLPLSESFIGEQLSHNTRWEMGLRWDFGKGNLLKTSRSVISE
ncbi:MAG: transporter [Chitinophagales bacterium]